MNSQMLSVEDALSSLFWDGESTFFRTIQSILYLSLSDKHPW